MKDSQCVDVFVSLWSNPASTTKFLRIGDDTANNTSTALLCWNVMVNCLSGCETESVCAS
jgi:hypothetical protein